jgi:beta-glucanase (GH16 family)
MISFLPTRSSTYLLYLALATPCFAKPEKADSILPGGAEKWALVWADEFDYPDPQLDQNWESQNGPTGHINSSRWRENVRVADGTLRLINKKEQRGGQEWTSGNIWTKRHFQYGYFECRYRYAAAPGTNNSFWLMTRGPDPQIGKRFEIDINEGHYPNEINTNIHNWSDITIINGKQTHPSSSKHFQFGKEPGHVTQLEIPVKTRRLRLSSHHAGAFHLSEWRVFAPGSNYPAVMDAKADLPQVGLINHTRAPGVTVKTSAAIDAKVDAKSIIDGKPATRWTSAREGMKWIELSFPTEVEIGCIQFINGFPSKGRWGYLADDYKLEYHDGRGWKEITRFDAKDGRYDFARDFHTYGLEWTEEELVFYFNGKPIRRERNTFCHSPAPIWLSLAIIKWAGPVTNAIDGTFMEVDHVRVYERKPGH